MIDSCNSSVINSSSSRRNGASLHSAHTGGTVAHRREESSLCATVKTSIIVGYKRGLLTVVSQVKSNPGKGKFYLCKCDCGNECVRSTSRLNDKYNQNQSCGCLRLESIKARSLAGNKARTKFSHPLKLKLKVMRGNMIKRCHVTGSNRFERYGARGISVCQEWRDNPTAFYQWAIKNGFQSGLWIERLNVDGNYCPENCTFKTPTEQANNTCRNRFLEWGGKRLTVSQWSRELGVSRAALQHRINRNWETEKALTTPFK